MFFEHSIPSAAPLHLALHKRASFEKLAATLIGRMSKLEEALTLSGLRGEVFSEAIASLMANRDACGNPQLDSMSADEIGDAAIILAKGLDEASIPDRITWHNCCTVVDTAFVTTPEWEIIRCLGIGGSDSACIMNDGFRTARDIYYDKTGEVEAEPTSADMQYIFEYGHRNEDLVINQFCRRTGAVRIKETRMFHHKDFPFLTANIDAIIRMKDENGAWQLYIFEAKTCTLANRKEWYGGAVPRKYMPQCRKYPIVLNDDRIKGTYIGCCYGNTPGDFSSSFVPRNKAVEFDQLQGEVNFWHDYVLAGVEPPLSTNGEKDLKTLNNKYGDRREDTVKKLEGEVPALISAYLTIEKRLKDAEEAVKKEKKNLESAQAQIIEAMEGAAEANCDAPDGIGNDPNSSYEFYVRNYVESPRVSVDSQKLKLQFPTVFDQVKKLSCTVKKFEVGIRRKT